MTISFIPVFIRIIKYPSFSYTLFFKTIEKLASEYNVTIEYNKAGTKEYEEYGCFSCKVVGYSNCDLTSLITTKTYYIVDNRQFETEGDAILYLKSSKVKKIVHKHLTSNGYHTTQINDSFLDDVINAVTMNDKDISEILTENYKSK